MFLLDVSADIFKVIDYSYAWGTSVMIAFTAAFMAVSLISYLFHK